MTVIKYRPYDYSIELNGHAGYGEYGKDIVCAGISALIYAVSAMLRKKDIRYFLDLNEPEGYLSIKAYPEKKAQHDCQMIFETVAAGLKLLADNYSDNAKFTREVI